MRITCVMVMTVICPHNKEQSRSNEKTDDTPKHHTLDTKKYIVVVVMVCYW